MRTVRARLIRPLEKTIAAGHPWAYRDAFAPFQAAVGDEVIVETRNGRFLARGLAEQGPIAVRVFTLRDQPIDASLLASRFDDALALRARLDLADTTALRLCHGEGDRLPGIVVDRYGSIAVLKLDGEAATARRELVASALAPALRACGIETLLVRTGRKEAMRVEAAFGRAPDALVHVLEHGMVLLSDLARGQKTGLFLDHRESRRRVRALARGQRVLNLYGYTGGFSVAAGLGGASHVTTVDVAPAAIELARATWAANELDPASHTAVADDVPRYLEANTSTRFDLVVADPPNFAPSAKSVEAALASYRKLHADCLARLARGGFYLAASCSSHVDMTAFLGTIREAAATLRRPVQVLERTSAPADHPRLAAFPEGDYLKVVLLRTLE
jgi:23S rRNA (cytosine1962-C5)-methyltransferase